jgi:xanthine dehydrogenase small subunit
MITFILNDKKVHTNAHPGTTLLDFIRYDQDLPGTKIGCREGDCGACTVLEGRLSGDKLVYRSIVSCLTPLGNAQGKHIVTVEGLNMEQLSPVQQAMVDHNGAQCGFCTPGFVVSLTGHTMSNKKSDAQGAIESVNGNICRCTGYKSIERAAISISNMLKDKNPDKPIEWLVENGFLPGYFIDIQAKMQEFKNSTNEIKNGRQFIGGGTDLMVQKPDAIAESDLQLVFDTEQLKGITHKDGEIIIGAAATANDIMHSPLLNDFFPDIKKHFKLISSDPIRNMGTIAGNIVNASPIADLSIFFLALGASVRLVSSENNRKLPLHQLFLDYKKLDMKPAEHIESISFPIPQKPFNFNFEKVSKRTHLDIASVNSALLITIENDRIQKCRVSLGGVSPIPLYAEKCSSFLEGNTLSPSVVAEAASVLDKEIAPISDVRGSKEYKRLLARQLFFAHFLELFPKSFSLPELIA